MQKVNIKDCQKRGQQPFEKLNFELHNAKEDSKYDFQCQQCFYVVIEPVKNKNCGHIFCLKCIKSEQVCPECGKDWHQEQIDD